MRHLFVLALSLVGLAASPSDAQYIDKQYLERRDTISDHLALVGLLFPTVTSDAGEALVLTFAFKEAVRARTTKRDDGPFGPRFLGFSQSYLVGAPLHTPSHNSAVELARLSGFQATVWGTADRYSYLDEFDGFAIRSVFSYAGQYEDFRDNPTLDLQLENWIVATPDVTVRVGIPSDRVDLPPYLISKDIYHDLVEGKVCARRTDTSECLPYLDSGPTRVRYVNPGTGEITFTQFGKEGLLTALLPEIVLTPSEAASYVAMFLNYARGHWSNTIDLADDVIAADRSTTQMVRDAHLYRSAALFRSGKDGRADLEAARALGRFSVEVGRFAIAAALLQYKAGRISREDWIEAVKSEASLVGADWLEENGIAFQN